MLLCDFGPVYIKCAFLFPATSYEDVFKDFNLDTDGLEYFELNLSIKYKDCLLIFFKINLYRTDKFKQSKDYHVIIAILEHLNKNKQKNNKEPCKTSAYYCGHVDEEKEKVIQSLFNLNLIKCGHINQLSVYGLDHISNNIESPFFDLPGQLITNLVKVGHGLETVTQKNQISLKAKFYPYLFANVIDGVSIYRIDSIDKLTRLGGSTFGATTYWSLVSLACGYDDPEEAVSEGIKGNNELIDLSVGDIYGGSYEKFSLSSQLIASSFGKLKYVQDLSLVERKDISRSLLTLLCVSISQITANIAKMSNVDKVIVLGLPFNCLEFMQMIQMGTNYFSGETVKALFSDYAPYINLIGMCKQMEMDNII